MGGVVSSMEHLDTFTKRFQYLYETDPGKELYVFYSSGHRDPYTSRDLYTMAGRFANRLRSHGFQKGDVIANTLPNSPERVITDLGIIMAGCIALNGQLLLADGADFFQNARRSFCSAVIISNDRDGAASKLLSQYITAQPEESFLTPLHVTQAETIRSAILVRRDSTGKKKEFIDELRASSENIFVAPSSPEDLAIVLTTSGSTGYSKLIHRTQADLIIFETYYARTVAIGMVWETPKDKNFKYYSDRALGWSVGLSTAPVIFGDTRVLGDHFKSHQTGRELWEAVIAEKCEVCSLLCLEMEHVLEHINETKSNYRLKTIVTGGQPLLESQIQKFLQFSDQVINVYGSQEAGPFCTNIYRASDKYFKSNSNGHVVDGMSLRVVSDDGRECAPNEMGTIEVKGYMVFRGYFNRLENPDPQTTKAFTSDGWFRMEDYGYCDEFGNVYVFGRNNDVILHGAEVVYPVCLETRLMEHPDVLQVCIVPVSDPILYQNLCACVKITKKSTVDEAALREFCDGIFLPEDPSFVSMKPDFYIIMKSNFPETATGKPDKQRLKRMAEEKFGRKD